MKRGRDCSTGEQERHELEEETGGDSEGLKLDAPNSTPASAEGEAAATAARTTATETSVGEGESECPFTLKITGEPCEPVRVENLIKLVVTIEPKKSGITFDWNRVFVNSPLLFSAEGVFVNNSVESSAHMVTKLNLNSSRLFITPISISEVEKNKGPYLIANLSVMKTDVSGGLVKAKPCRPCVEREVRKLSATLLTPTMLRASKRDKNVEDVIDMLETACSHSMVIAHCAPIISLNKSGSPEFTLKFRVICYSSHHKKQNFFIFLRLFDPETNKCVAVATTQKIVILDNHKQKAKNRRKQDASDPKPPPPGTVPSIDST